MYTITCRICSKQVESLGKNRRFCEDCGRQRIKIQSRKATQRWLSGKRGRKYIREWDADGAKAAARQRAYRHTGKGRASTVRDRCRKAGVPSENAERVAAAIIDDDIPCYWCGCVGSQLDHVLPISIAKLCGLEHVVDEYVGVMCRSCHYSKSSLDRSDFYRMRREMPES